MVGAETLKTMGFCNGCEVKLHRCDLDILGDRTGASPKSRERDQPLAICVTWGLRPA